MIKTHRELRKAFAEFWEKNNHKEVPPIPLVPQNDPTTLFTGSGMQQLVPYLLGEPHPLGEKLFNIQPCFRSQDIEEIGDNRHTTFFEMMGNWSLGAYFKKEQLVWFFEFLVETVNLDPKKLYATVFAGENSLPKDEESIEIWKNIYKKYGIDAKIGERIFLYGPEKNWWSRAGVPANMPAGEPGGPDSEVFYEFTSVPHNTEYGASCHPNCECGRFLEIGNSVFMQYKKMPDGSFEELPKKNVDFGGGLERILAAINNNPDVFQTDIFADIIKTIEKVSGKSYAEQQNQLAMRIVANHIKASVFLIINGVKPSNKTQGYVLRRLLRTATMSLRSLEQKINEHDIMAISQSVIQTYNDLYFFSNSSKNVDDEIGPEISRFTITIEKGIKEIQKIDTVDGKVAFNLYQSFGLPLEIIEELAKQKGQTINHEEFEREFNKHKELSRSTSAGMFKGGLADHSEQTIKYHTATHLLHQALFDILGGAIRQEGSHITGERLRFDFSSSRKPTEEELKKIEEIINQKIKEQLPVEYKILPKEEALKLGARSFFREKYPDMVKVYCIADYSKEFCGGPHVKNTKEIGTISLYKFENIGSNLYRIYAK